MSAYNISFCGEIRKAFCGYPVVLGAMIFIICLDSAKS